MDNTMADTLREFLDQMIDALASSGYTIYCIYTGSNWSHPTVTWPSNGGTAQTAFDDALLQAAADGMDAANAHIFGQSMGGGNSLHWAWENQTKVRSMFLYVPMVDMMATYDEPQTEAIGGRVSMRTVYGAADRTALESATANNDPARNVPKIAGADLGPRTTIFALTGDEVAPYAETAAFAASIDANLVSSPGSHFYYSSSNLEEISIPRWFEAHN
jgi:acetyl esterase/lipase